MTDRVGPRRRAGGRGRPGAGSGPPGFTLVEILIVVVILGVLATMAIPSYRNSIEQARADLAAANLRTIWAAERFYYLGARAYTGDFNELAAQGALEPGLLASDEMYQYEVVAADASGFTATATRTGSATYNGTLTITETGAIVGEVVGDGRTIRPGFR